MGLGGLLLVGVIVLLLFLSGAFTGGSGFDIPGQNLPAMPGGGQGLTGTGQDAELADFVAFVVDDVQNAWRADFRSAGRTYETTKLVLFDGQTQSGCGPASSETGPFYCPTDRKVYLDLGFFRELRDRFGAPGDFAEAYVIAHEFGHHVQNQLGTMDRVDEEEQSHPVEANDLSVRLELQADCYAGVWAHSAFEQGELEPGDIDEALRAAAAVGDDRIQRAAGQRVNPETWTHGSSEERAGWFKAGYANGDPADCDTFSASI